MIDTIVNDKKFMDEPLEQDYPPYDDAQPEYIEKPKTKITLFQGLQSDLGTQLKVEQEKFKKSNKLTDLKALAKWHLDNINKMSEIKGKKQQPKYLMTEIKNRSNRSGGALGALTDKLVWKASQNRAIWWKKYNEAIVQNDEARAQKLKKMLTRQQKDIIDKNWFQQSVPLKTWQRAYRYKLKQLKSYNEQKSSKKKEREVDAH